jgi:hypothetical protein
MLDEILDEIMTDGAEPLEEKVIVVKHQKAKQRAKAKAYRMKNKSRLKMRAKKYKMRIKNKPKKKGFSYGRDGRLHRITRRKGVRKTGHHH